MALWRDLPVAEHTVSSFRGLHESMSPAVRPLGALSFVSNLIIAPAPALSTRPGLTSVGTQVAAGPINGIHGYYDTVNNVGRLLAAVGTTLYRYDSGTNSWVAISGSLNANAKATFANIALGNDDIAVIFHGGTPQKLTGTTLANLGGNPPPGKYVVSAYEQLFVAGMTSRPSDVDFCDVAAPETWSPAPDNDAGSISVGAREGDYITWLGFDKTQGKVIIWTRYGLVVLNGPETPNRPSLWSVRTVSFHGTPNGRTVQDVGGTWVWLTDQGFAFWSGGVVEVVRDPIRTSLGLIDWTRIDDACAWVDFDGRYWCSVPKTGGGVLWFCYDTPNQQWFTGAGPAIRVAGSFRFSGRETPLIGDDSGNVYKPEGDTDNGSAIPWSVEIGPSVLGDPFRKKQITQVSVVLSLAAGATASVALATSETGPFGPSKTITASTDLTQVELPVPLNPGEVSRSGVFRLRLSGTGKVTIHDVAIRYMQGGR